ncbi:MAG: GNAT family N-acetyltransferase [Actinobacteria bacterium]|nr:GNAT family N-acetyltransferase [Actinomycetota bacterium]
MRVDVVKATGEHRSVIAEHVAVRARQLIERVPLVPDTFADAATVVAALSGLDGGLFVAVDNTGVVGHLGWHDLPDARRTRRPGVWMPEFAHSAASDDVRDALFARASVAWEASGRRTLMVSTLVDEARDWWHLNGFGTFLHDTVLAPISFVAGDATGVLIRAATAEDATALAELDVEHCAHYALPPTFMVAPEPWGAARWLQFVTDHPGLTQVALQQGEPCGFVRLEFGAADLPLLASAGSATVTGIFVRPDVRTAGIGAALLSHGAAAAGVAGARLVTADHETTNPTARRFWPRHSTTVAVSMMRVLERS